MIYPIAKGEEKTCSLFKNFEVLENEEIGEVTILGSRKDSFDLMIIIYQNVGKLRFLHKKKKKVNSIML